MNKRISKRIFTRIRTSYGASTAEATGFVLNISAEGLFLSGVRLFPPGTPIEMRLLPIGAAAIDVRGTVRWGMRVPQNMVSVVRPGMGVRLASPADSYLDFFTRLAAAGPKRAYPRLPVHLEVRFYSRENFIREYTENISRGGLYIVTDQPPDAGTEITVDILVPDLAASWPVTGRVAYVLDAERARALDTQPGIGVEITRIDQQTEEAFRTYVEQLMRHYT